MEAITTVGQLLFVLGVGFILGVIGILFTIAFATLWAWLALLISSIATRWADQQRASRKYEWLPLDLKSKDKRSHEEKPSRLFSSG